MSVDNQNIVKRIDFIFLVGLILLSIVIVLLRIFVIGPFTVNSILVIVVEGLMGIIVPLFIINIFYEYLVGPFQAKALSEQITATMLLDKEIIDSFSNDTKKTFISVSARSILGDEVGNILYSTLIEPYLKREFSFRKDFKYYIDLEEPEESLQVLPDLSFSKDNYDLVSQNLTYHRLISEGQEVSSTLYVGLAFEENQLEKWLGTGEFVFREMIPLTETDRTRLMQCSIEDIEHLVRDIFQLHVAINDIDRHYVIRRDNQDLGIILDLAALDKETKYPGKEYKFHISFQMPQLKNHKRFLVSLPEPTYGVYIHFRHFKRGLQLTAIPFFDEDRETDKKHLQKINHNKFVIEYDRWVLARSGVVFVWDD